MLQKDIMASKTAAETEMEEDSLKYYHIQNLVKVKQRVQLIKFNQPTLKI